MEHRFDPATDPLAGYREPLRSQVRAQARALAERLADHVSGYGVGRLGWSVEEIERAILEQCVPRGRSPRVRIDRPKED